MLDGYLRFRNVFELPYTFKKNEEDVGNIRLNFTASFYKRKKIAGVKSKKKLSRIKCFNESFWILVNCLLDMKTQ